MIFRQGFAILLIIAASVAFLVAVEFFGGPVVEMLFSSPHIGPAPH